MIACLGWGSLIWRVGGLPILGQWHPDGPDVKVEFLRKSSENRLTLVLFPKANEAVPCLWARMDAVSLSEAILALARREGSNKPIGPEHIGCWPGDAPTTIIDLETWAEKNAADHVIWTALPPKFTDPKTGKDRNGCWPSEQQAVEYLSKLIDTGVAAKAKEYVQRAPAQIDTAYRRRFSRCFEWTPQLRKLPR